MFNETMNKDCTVYKATGFIGKKWSLNILLEIYKNKDSCRYSHLKRQIPPITAKVLSLRLKELENAGLLSHTIDADPTPVRSFYSLTPAGKAFIKIIKDIKSWTLEYQEDNEHCQATQCQDCKF